MNRRERIGLSMRLLHAAGRCPDSSINPVKFVCVCVCGVDVPQPIGAKHIIDHFDLNWPIWTTCPSMICWCLFGVGIAYCAKRVDSRHM